VSEVGDPEVAVIHDEVVQHLLREHVIAAPSAMPDTREEKRLLDKQVIVVHPDVADFGLRIRDVGLVKHLHVERIARFEQHVRRASLHE
jgi:hypothetical protein